MSDTFSLFDIMLLAIAVYVLYAGITGKGRLYNAENIKEGMEEKFKALTRKIYIFLGIAMIINSGASLTRGLLYGQVLTEATETTAAFYTWEPKVELGGFSFMTPTVFNIISYVALGITLALIIFLVIKMRAYTDKEAAKKRADSAAGSAKQSACTLPRSAFEFDDEDKK